MAAGETGPLTERDHDLADLLADEWPVDLHYLDWGERRLITERLVEVIRGHERQADHAPVLVGGPTVHGWTTEPCECCQPRCPAGCEPIDEQGWPWMLRLPDGSSIVCPTCGGRGFVTKRDSAPSREDTREPANSVHNGGTGQPDIGRTEA